jgi:hypothetical protein
VHAPAVAPTIVSSFEARLLAPQSASVSVSLVHAHRLIDGASEDFPSPIGGLVAIRWLHFLDTSIIDSDFERTFGRKFTAYSGAAIDHCGLLATFTH